jgi:putative ubiquitin-RnfH superfamily antitoxin RatB of RatAB toxin-antitoxin module
MDPAEPAPVVHVEVVYCPRPGATDLVALMLPAGATAADALHASGLAQRHALAADGLRLGVWCKVCEPGTVLRDRDRVEVYRPLTVDPKEARRQRYSRHKERSARR